MMKVHEFYPTIYPRRVWVVKKGKPEDLQGVFSDKDGNDLEMGDYEGAKACVWHAMHRDSKRLGVLVLLREDITVADVAHEADHVANKIFTDCAIDFTTEHDEHHAYLVGWAADCLWQTWTGKFKE